MKAHLLILLLLSSFAIKSMEIPSHFKELPVEFKLVIVDQLLEQPDLEKIINDLESLSLVDVEFYNFIINEPSYKPFFELNKLNKIKNPVTALKFVSAHQDVQRYPYWAEFLHQKFPYLPAKVFEKGLDLLERPEFYQSMELEGLIDKNKMIHDKSRSLVFYSLLLGVSVNAPDKDGFTPLMHAVMNNDQDIAELLLQNGANPNAMGKEGLSIIARAAINKNDRMMDLLIGYGAAVNDAVIQQFKDVVNNFNEYWSGFISAQPLGTQQLEDIRENIKSLQEALPILEKYKRNQ